MDPASPAATPLPTPISAETARYLRQRLWARWLSRAFVLSGVAIVLFVLHLLSPESFTVATELTAVLCTLLGLVSADFRLYRSDAPETVTEVVSQDLARLEQCFAILQKQVGVTIRTSEHAVLEMVERLHRVHQRSSELHRHVMEAVGRSRHISEASQNEADGNRATVATLASSQEAFIAARKLNQQRIGLVVAQVRRLTPLAALISDISRQTSLLSINASIEAARAGPEGAGFKVVATEVRRLSAQTAEAAQQISDGIHDVADTIEGELVQANQLDSEGNAAHQLTAVASHIAQISASLDEVVPYLAQLSQNMHTGIEVITTDIIDAMGHMQFQDVNRQLLEQVESALGSLSEHSAALYALVGGDAPPPPLALEELMDRWADGYVSEAQRTAHNEVRRAAGTQQGRKGPHGQDPSAQAPQAVVPAQQAHVQAADLQLAAPEVPRIELF
ncbi:methyl-accepting chemotaxis protein (MCP) signaling protein [Aquabacterium commune]|uniref:Methyl-accepting chemotaxis protein (MCP) signaling protein n=1 Tax=Aquabacterium commune TaxID=70586 RepID=A0A4R6R6U5_9BURK|nr:methyl-accepting chemotaxis protein [Aquabacterium commune]TDP81267.1 methyl-accepting chemotaxis protein (MCP) signaling protein [Aquabacterium commune]